MKKTHLLGMGLVSLLALTSCGGKSIEPAEASKILENVNKSVETSVKEVKNFTAITTLKIDLGKDNPNSKNMVTKFIASTEEHYFCQELRLNDEIKTATYVWIEDDVAYTFDFATQKLVKVPTKLDAFDKEVKGLLDGYATTQLEGLATTLSSLMVIDNDAVIASQKEAFGDDTEVNVTKLEKYITSRNDLSVAVEVTGVYDSSITFNGVKASAHATENGVAEIRDGLPYKLETSSTIVVNGNDKELMNQYLESNTTFDYGAVEVTIPQIQE